MQLTEVLSNFLHFVKLAQGKCLFFFFFPSQFGALSIEKTPTWRSKGSVKKMNFPKIFPTTS